MHGDIFESSKGIQNIKTSDDSDLKRQIIERYITNGISACVGLNGNYNLLVWNFKESSLEIANDRISIRQVFFASLQSGFVLTTDVSLLKFCPGFNIRLNKRGIFDLVYLGLAFEERTILENVQRLLPNTSYRIEGGQLRKLQEFRIAFSNHRWGEVVPKLLDELEFYYVQAIQRQLRPNTKTVFFQSGGKDSRVFSYFLKQAGIKPDCRTMGEDHHGEVFLAKWVDRELGFPWQRVPIKQEFNPFYAKQILQLDSYSKSIFATWTLELVNNITNQWDYAVMTSLGDAVCGNELHKCRVEDCCDSREAFSNLINAWRRGYLSEQDIELLFPKEGKELIDEFQKEAFEVFERLGEEPYQMMMLYGFRTIDRFRMSDPLRCANAAFPIRAPYLDNDLEDFLFSLPPALLHKRLFLDMFLKLKARRLGSIPLDRNDDSYAPLVPSLKKQMKTKLWEIHSKYFKFPLIRAMSKKIPTSQFYVQMFSLNHKGFCELRDEAFSSLSSLENIMDVHKAGELLNKPFPEEPDHIIPGNAIRSLVTAAIIGQEFTS